MTTSHPAVTDPSVDHALQLIITGESIGSSCAPELADGPWLLDTPAMAPGYGPGASQADPLPLATPRQQVLPESYQQATEEELHARIRAAKTLLGDRVVQLARAAKRRPEAEAIVFCGVHFMAETADLLSTDDQAVILPNLAAGCSMADMADLDSVEDCWEQLEEIYGTEPDDQGRAPVIPVTYMNSSAALKGFVGRHGGIVCTSSNAAAVLEWAFERGQRVLFFPDQHLGRNTAKAMGIPLEQMPLWNPNRTLGGNTREELEDAKVLLWHGFCSVHKRFTVEQIEKARREYPDVHVVVHPESPMPVVDAADSSGSTDFIVKAIQAAPAGSTFAIGTEINLVQRLAAQYPQHTIFCLDPVICPCSTMYRIHPGYLAWVLEELIDGRVVNQISVGEDVADPARVALERMLAVVPTQSAATKGATK